MSKLLVTGCAGMIMSHVCDHLLKNSHEVVGIDDLSGGKRSNVPDGVEFIRCSLSNAGSLFRRHKFFAVLHGAAFAAENLSHNTRVFTIQNNLAGEAIIRNACINYDVQCMVSLSSIAVMGHERPPFGDGAAPNPRDVYGIMKFAGELDARSAHDFHGLNYSVVRPHNVVGTHQNYSDRYRNVAAIFIRQALEGRPLTIFGDGSQTRAFSPVSYVAQIIAEIVDKPEVWNQTFNVGSDRVMTVKALADMVAKLADVSCQIDYLPARKEASHAHMIHTICRKHFSHVPEPPLEKVLREMIAEARKKGFSRMQTGPEIEVGKGLPENWK